MTQQFLEGLPQIPLGELPTNSSCMICLNSYGSGSENDGIPEGPVRLPCGHHVGSVCSAIWLSPNNMGHNSCPYCRAMFFPALPRPYMEHGLMNEDDDDDDSSAPVLILGNNMHELTRRVGRIGRPVQGNDEGFIERGSSERNSQGIYAYFFERTAAQYQESLQRARAITNHAWQSENQNPVDTNDHELVEMMERDIASLANSFRTLAFRELILYIRLMSEGSLLPNLSHPIRALNHRQEEALFLDLERREVFQQDHDRPGYAHLSDRQRWQLHRETDGEVWNWSVRRWTRLGAD